MNPKLWFTYRVNFDKLLTFFLYKMRSLYISYNAVMGIIWVVNMQGLMARSMYSIKVSNICFCRVVFLSCVLSSEPIQIHLHVLVSFPKNLFDTHFSSLFTGNTHCVCFFFCPFSLNFYFRFRGGMCRCVPRVNCVPLMCGVWMIPSPS